MSRFKNLIKKKQTAEALAKHPLAGADAQLQKDYVQGLIFVAVEDEVFSEEEKVFIKLLMQHINMDESQLESLEAFANSPDEDELMAFMDRLKALDESLKINFLVEVILLAFKDGNYNDKEQVIFNDYLEMLDLQNHANTIELLGKAIANQDMDMALALYTTKKETVEPLLYLFDLAEMDVQKELGQLYQWQWVKWDLTAGGIWDDNLVATKPITARQIAVFMNALQLAGKVEQLPNSQRFEHKNEDGMLKPLIEDLSLSNVQWEDARFAYKEEDKDQDVIGVSTAMPGFFTEWLNALREEQVGLLYVKTFGESSGLSGLFHQSFGLTTAAQTYLTDSPEMVLMNLGSSEKINKTILAGGSNICYCDNNDGNLKAGIAYTFRLMKLSQEGESES